MKIVKDFEQFINESTEVDGWSLMKALEDLADDSKRIRDTKMYNAYMWLHDRIERSYRDIQLSRDDIRDLLKEPQGRKHARNLPDWAIEDLFRVFESDVNESVNEAKLPIDKSWSFGGDIIDFLDTIPELEKFRDSSATYDDPHFTIPIKDFKKIVGWSEKEVKEIDDRLEDYEGYIMWSKEDVVVGDGA